MDKIRANRLFKDIIKFALVGAISTTIDIVILNFAYKALEINLLWATFWGFIGGTINGFFINNYWTYNHRPVKSKSRGLIKYFIISAIGLGLTEIIMHQLAVESNTHYNIAKLIAVFIVFFWNFFANRYWTFKK